MTKALTRIEALNKCGSLERCPGTRFIAQQIRLSCSVGKEFAPELPEEDPYRNFGVVWRAAIKVTYLRDCLTVAFRVFHVCNSPPHPPEVTSIFLHEQDCRQQRHSLIPYICPPSPIPLPIPAHRSSLPPTPPWRIPTLPNRMP